jgi:hypothetical protein
MTQEGLQTNEGLGGIDIAEIIALMDQMKADLRKELATKNEVYEIDVKIGNIEEDLDSMRLSQDISNKKIKENTEEIESKRLYCINLS